MKRREFLKTSAALAALAGSADLLKAGNVLNEKGKAAPESGAESAGGPLIASNPVLQNYAPTSMGVAFAVSALAAGYVLYGREPDLSDAVKVKCGGFRAIDIDNRIIQVRLTGLKPSTKYYYRIGADRIHYGGGYDMKVIGNEEDSRIYSFKTAGPKNKAHFCVINDTHVQWGPFGRAIDKIAQLDPTCVVWNGDASNTEETVDAQEAGLCLRQALSFLPRQPRSARHGQPPSRACVDVPSAGRKVVPRLGPRAQLRNPHERCRHDRPGYRRG